jgi:hypothetical protein
LLGGAREDSFVSTSDNGVATSTHPRGAVGREMESSCVLVGAILVTPKHSVPVAWPPRLCGGETWTAPKGGYLRTSPCLLTPRKSQRSRSFGIPSLCSARTETNSPPCKQRCRLQPAATWGRRGNGRIIGRKQFPRDACFEEGGPCARKPNAFLAG